MRRRHEWDQAEYTTVVELHVYVADMKELATVWADVIHCSMNSGSASSARPRCLSLEEVSWVTFKYELGNAGRGVDQGSSQAAGAGASLIGCLGKHTHVCKELAHARVAP
jgi:hypothetical protein